MFSLSSLSLLLAATASTVSAAILPRGGTVSVTPHEQFSSSVGVVGCYINTNRVAYWPGAVDCNNICVKLSYGGRSLTVLKIDSSGGAHDISYDAWNYLISGKSATESPRTGGGFNMQWEYVDNSQCAQHLNTGKLPLTASNSVNFVANCLNQKNSWVARNYQFYNFLDSLCHFGWDETCTLNLQTSNQPTCPHRLGDAHQPTGKVVRNIQYGTGKVYVA